MALTFAELGKLERVLIARGSNIVTSEELDRMVDGLNEQGIPEHFNEQIAKLAAVGRSAQNRRAAEVAIGALVLVGEEWRDSEHKALAVLRFAQQRVDSLDCDGTYWANVVLNVDDEANARALFEAAVGDASYSENDLISAAQEFIQSHDGKNSLFGRLASDLNILVKILEEDRSSRFVEIARAALTYFAETADAIPDDMGFVGLLDDAYIVQQAVDQVLPGRSGLTDYLEGKVKRWPFLKNLDFVAEGRSVPMSDYVLINSVLLLDTLESEAKSTAVIVPEAGPLPYLLGFVTALSGVADSTNSGGAVLQSGDRLIDRDASGEVVFHAYLRQEGVSFAACGPEVATHVQVVHPARGRVAEVRRTIPIAELGNFRRTALGIGNRARSPITINVAERKAGPLERLVGTNAPVILDAYSPAVLVVAPIGSSKVLSTALELFEVPAVDVIPTGHLHRVEDGFDVVHWSKYGLGGEPMLCIVRSLDEAYEAVVSSPLTHRTVSTVISEVRPDSADASQLVRIAGQGVGVLAFASPDNLELLEALAAHGVKLWQWDESWFGMLFRPQPPSLATNAVAAYERRLGQRLKAKNEIETVEFDEVSALANCLTAMGSELHGDLDPHEDWIRRAWWLLCRFCRWLTPIGADARGDFRMTIEELKLLLHRNRNQFSQDFENNGQAVVELFGSILTSACDHNPKYARLLSLGNDNPGATILVAERDRVRLTEALANTNVLVTSQDIRNDGATLRIIPAWYGQKRMATLAFAATHAQQLLLLYKPELEWFTQAKHRRQRSMLKTKELVHRHAAISITGCAVTQTPPQHGELKHLDDPDEVVRKAIYRLVDESHRDTEHRVKAAIVGFAGGAWAAFTPAHRLVVVGHLFNPDSGSDEVQSMTVSQLGEGDIILLLRGSDRDAIRERASLSLSEDAIHDAELWKRALQQYIHANEDLEELRQSLAWAGCPKHMQTIRGWISNDYLIGPQQTEPVISAIARTTGNKELIDRKDACLTAIREVRSAHSTAGKWLAKRVLERAREWTDAGATPDDLIELEEQLVMATVEFVDAGLREVPVKLINCLQYSQWHV